MLSNPSSSNIRAADPGIHRRPGTGVRLSLPGRKRKLPIKLSNSRPVTIFEIHRLKKYFLLNIRGISEDIQ